jgi:flagellin-like protein
VQVICDLKRRAISPFIATAVLIVATVVIGGMFFTQIRDYISTSTRNPSLSLVDYTVSPDLRTFTLNVRNDGNTNINITKAVVKIDGSDYTFLQQDGQGNLTFYSPGSTIKPGEVASLALNFTTMPAPLPSSGDKLYVVLVGDVLSKTMSVTV